MGRSRSNSFGSSKKKAKAHKKKQAKKQKQPSPQKQQPPQKHPKHYFFKSLDADQDDYGTNNHRKRSAQSQSQQSQYQQHQPIFGKTAASSHSQSPTASPASSSSSSNKHKKKSTRPPRDELHLGNYHSIVESSMGLSCQLPPKHAGQRLHQIPWMSPEAISAASAKPTIMTPKKKQRRKQQQHRSSVIRLPTDDVDPVRLDQLTIELRDLANYVRLTPDEVYAREQVIQELTRVAQSIATFPNAHYNYANNIINQHIRFGVSSSSSSTKQQENDIHFRTFGSFAAPDVCTFVSDVDLALWGAVRAIPMRASPRCSNTSRLTPEKKRQQVLAEKWKSALHAMDEDNAVSPGNIPAAVDDEDDDDNGETSKTGNEEDGDDAPLFVIDRTGERGDDTPQATEDREMAQTNSQGRGPANQEVIDLTNSPAADSTRRPNGKSDDEDSDEDSADKLESFDASKQPPPATEQSSTSLQRLNHLVSRSPSSSDDESDNDTEDDEQTKLLHQWAAGKSEFDGMEVGFVGIEEEVHDEEDDEDPVENFTVLKRDAVDALNQLQRRLRRARKVALDINFIRHARVPIVKFKSPVGVEFDISIGGQNGADTSLYAGKQCKRYESFAPVVLALKIIMAQQDLDTPFTGGLGSFKLYVLVAHHIQLHLALGGQDSPGEIFLSFLFRYGSPSATGDHCVDERAKTLLSQESCPKCQDGCEADLSNVFKIADCCHLFGAVWKRLWGRIRYLGKSSRTKSANNPPASLLGELINAEKLTRDRESSREAAGAIRGQNKRVENHANPYSNQGVTVRMPPGPPSAANSAKAQRKKSAAAAKKNSSKRQNKLGDKDAYALMAGYGVFGSPKKKARK